METMQASLTKWPESKMAVRFSDCDLYGHLNNVWYIKYFLDAREDHIAENYGLTLAKFAQLGVGWVVSSNQIAYFKPARVNESVVVRSAIVGHQTDQILVEMQMLDSAASHFKSVMWSRFVHVGLKDGKRTAHSAEMTELFDQLRAGDYADRDFHDRIQYLRSVKPSDLTSV
ncbi:MAG: acyl-CoA thioesterase [Bacteroidota bacterium]